MRLVSPTRRAALVAAAVTAAAGAAIAFSPLGDSPAAADTPPSSAPCNGHRLTRAPPVLTPTHGAWCPTCQACRRRRPAPSTRREPRPPSAGSSARCTSPPGGRAGQPVPRRPAGRARRQLRGQRRPAHRPSRPGSSRTGHGAPRVGRGARGPRLRRAARVALVRPEGMCPLRPLEDILALLTRAGFSGPDALHIYRALFGFLHGHVVDEFQELIENSTRPTTCSGWACTGCRSANSRCSAAWPRPWPTTTAPPNSNAA